MKPTTDLPVAGQQLQFDVSAVTNDKHSHEVTVTNVSEQSARYMALMGFENHPAYIEQLNTGGGIRIIEHRVGDLMQDYTLEPGNSITFVVNISDYTLKMGFPVYDGHFNQQVHWFYVKPWDCWIMPAFSQKKVAISKESLKIVCF